MYIPRLASNEIFLPSNKIHREAGRAKGLSAPLYWREEKNLMLSPGTELDRKVVQSLLWPLR
jgi:hypothetical protein